jgi:hypothetical protein
MMGKMIEHLATNKQFKMPIQELKSDFKFAFIFACPIYDELERKEIEKLDSYNEY